MTPEEAVTRLRARHRETKRAGEAVCWTVVVLDQLEAAEADRDRWVERAFKVLEERDALKAERDAAEADADRLAEALREVATYFPADEFHYGAGQALLAHRERRSAPQ